MKSQAITDLLAQFPRKEEFPLDDEIPGEVATAEVAEEQWFMKFDGSSIASSGGVRVVLYHNSEETIQQHTAEYKARN